MGSIWPSFDLPVAVVNKDQSATYNGQKMEIGKDMVSNLKDNDSLDFHFVDEKAAKDGLKMAIII